MLAEGTYRARCTGDHDVQFGYSKNGTEQIALLFDLLDEHGQATGERITWIGFFSEKALPITKDVLRACGWEGENLTDLAGIDANDVDLVIKHEEYDGKTFPRVKFVNRAGAAGRVALKNVMDDAQRKAFAERMRGEFHDDKPKASGGRPAVSRAPAPRQPARQATGTDDYSGEGADDIPF